MKAGFDGRGGGEGGMWTASVYRLPAGMGKGREGGGGSPPNTERCASSASLGCLFEAGENGVGGHEWRSVGARLCENLVCAADGPSGRVASGLRPLVRPHRQRGTSRGPWCLRGHEVVRQVPKVLLRPAHSKETQKKGKCNKFTRAADCGVETNQMDGLLSASQPERLM